MPPSTVTSLKARCVELTEESGAEILLSMQVKIRGIKYKICTVLLLPWENECLPALAVIENTAVVEHTKYFICAKPEIKKFSSHYNSFVVTRTADPSTP